MAFKIKADTLQALADWKAGKAVRTVQLAHIHRMQEHPGMSAQIDTSAHVYHDQERAHAYCFHLIELFSISGMPATHDQFMTACDEYEQIFDWGELPATDRNIFDEERSAAESLAWKALLVGWNKALDGHKDVDYIEVKREE